MFFNLIVRNSKRSRKENGLFFSSLVISIVAFYIILSISNQDIMRFLQEMESGAVDKLLLLIPIFYIVTLCILFFLIYFACKYQLQRRKHEFGVYLMLGMRRGKLFSMLMAEDFISSIFALVIGLPIDIALILPDEQFFYYTQGNYNVYVNGILDQNITNEMGLMGAYSAINEVLDMIDLDAIGLEYESYLQSMGRQLFYMVAASYITSYLAIIFLVVSNTIIGVQFLMNQQRTGCRYQTLVRLGATYHALCGSARKQITWFMGLPVIVAAISSLFGVKSLFAGILSSEVKNAQGEMLVIAAIIILILCVVECIYMTVIKRSSDRYLLTLMQPQREE